ncbi:nucleotidyltransferase family protein [Bermanella marisrubri]|uniref:Nucleotidyl transferase n=1 Tax=Bermanella marisrubri TaxID=207949 RepID=Q1N3R4_9GAMM|nr:nucleotidyltransferase family protein [Bermanella marisrubri]EAT12810.1 Nucleotidyl transferase [Oceanobacter sp. RED65] [Bermanella marisrubri]QIZ83133.1 nucleotidyltransferase family protein [Bermanella marisrubri]
MKAMILAAGRGTRMKHLTDNSPKPMLQVAGKPLIAHHVERLVKAGFNELVINHAYLGEQIEAYLGDGSAYGCQIQYSHEKTALETGGGIFQALPLLVNEREPCFAVVNGDVWSDMDYQRLNKGIHHHAHLFLVGNPSHNPDGDFALHNGMVKVSEGEEAFTFSGLSILHKDLFDGCESGAFKLAPLLKKAMHSKQVTGDVYRGYWLDVGTPERLQEINQRLLNQ